MKDSSQNNYEIFPLFLSLKIIFYNLELNLPIRKILGNMIQISFSAFDFFQISNSNCLLQILKLHMVLFKLEMIQANNKLFFTGKNHTHKSNTFNLP
jgi:hypothetical protein